MKMESAKTDAGPAIDLAWSGNASTKFRAPRIPRDVVARDALVQRTRSFALEKRVTLAQAPAGSGKSTLLAQATAACAPAEVIWLSLDGDDDDANRLFASLLEALRDVQLEWEADPLTVIFQVSGSSEQSRAAVNLLVNALCTFEGERLIIVLDDLHRVTDAHALKLLDYLIDRVPPEVGFLIGTRVTPELSLARWRSRGDLGELQMADLQFDEQDTQALATARLAGAATSELVKHALERTQGWVAGLQLLFGAGSQTRPGSGQASRHTFDFLAQEVIADLPHDLREFAMRCSVLPELSPTLCAAVADDPAVRAFLDELLRRNLFVTIVDDVKPVLRFHDLFREFLQRELEARIPAEEVRRLHARAARAESVPTRVVAHWLKAEMWDVAVAAIGRYAEPLIADGGHALVDRWIDQLPADQQLERADVVRLRALCHWSRYDLKTVRRLLERASALYRERTDKQGLARTLPLLARLANYTGDLESCDRLIQECEELDLDAAGSAALSAVRAWNALATGRNHEIANWLKEIIEAGRRDPGVLYPSISDMFNGFFYGKPGVLAEMNTLKAVCAHAEQLGPVHWQVSALARTAWPEFFRGDYTAATAAFAEQEQFQRRHSGLPAYWLDMNQLRSAHLAASGRAAESVQHLEASLQLIQSAELADLRESWLRLVILDAARFAWAAEDVRSLRKFTGLLNAPLAPTEWPALTTGFALARGRCALLDGRLDVAERELREACDLHARQPCLINMGEPRTTLAFLQLTKGDTRAAWSTFAPVWQEALAEDAVGALLLEPGIRFSQLLAAMPAAQRREPPTQELLARIDSWKQAPDKARERANETASALATLTEREREVLARIAAGDSNKLIARLLDLSPHTVKRHVANILDKLDVPTRGAASALHRQARQMD